VFLLILVRRDEWGTYYAPTVGAALAADDVADEFDVVACPDAGEDNNNENECVPELHNASLHAFKRLGFSLAGKRVIVTPASALEPLCRFLYDRREVNFLLQSMYSIGPIFKKVGIALRDS
jgi:hypothetical protein